jgi:hypothetical protein
VQLRSVRPLLTWLRLTMGLGAGDLTLLHTLGQGSSLVDGADCRASGNRCI